MATSPRRSCLFIIMRLHFNLQARCMLNVSKICQQCLMSRGTIEGMASAPVRALWGSCKCHVCKERGRTPGR